MKIQTLADLKEEANRMKKALLARLHDRYYLARKLGFSATEAKLLQGRSEAYIRAMAEELTKSNK